MPFTDSAGREWAPRVTTPIIMRAARALRLSLAQLMSYDIQIADMIECLWFACEPQAIERKIGARGLRMIIEDIMLDLMYTLPGQKKIKECVITREVVESKEKPITVIEKAG